MDPNELLSRVCGLHESPDARTFSHAMTADAVRLKAKEVLRRLEESAALARVVLPVAHDAMTYGLGGIRVYVNDLCDVPVPARQHKHRRGQSAAYHARIQKKWAKRYGTTIEHRLLMLPNGVMGGGRAPRIVI